MGAVVFVAIVALVGTLVIARGHDSDVAERGPTPEHQPAPYPSSTHDYPTSSSTSDTTTTSSESSTSSTSSERSSHTSVTGPSRETSSGPTPVHALADNPLFASKDYGLHNVACDLPRWDTNPTAAERFFRGARDCLDESWHQLLGALDLPARSPSLKFPSGTSWSSPCGSVERSEAVAFYCGENETIYMPAHPR